MAIFLFLIFIWAAFTSVPKIAECPGQIVPKGNVKLIQPVADGVVEQTFVKEGQQVAAGDKLVLLDRIPFGAELDKCRKDEQIARSQLSEHERAREALAQIIKDPAKLPAVAVDISNVSQIITDVYTNHSLLNEAKTDASASLTHEATANSPLPANSDMSMLEDRLRSLVTERAQTSRTLTNRKVEYANKQKELAIETESLKKQVASLREQRKKNESILEKTRQQHQAVKGLFEVGAVSKMEFLNIAKMMESQELDLISKDSAISTKQQDFLKAQSAEAEFDGKSHADLSKQQGDIYRLSGEVAQVAMQVRERRRHMSLTDSTYHAALERAHALLAQESDEVLHQKVRVEQFQSALKAAQDKYDRAEICAPIAGLVTSFKLTGKGQVVSQKETLMTLVPAQSELVVEARLPNKDIGFVRKGQDVKIKLDSFPFQDYGIVKGTVEEVESHPREDAKLASYYRVIVHPERTWVIARGQRIPFTSGMALKAEIATRYRTVLSIFLEPIKSLKETRWN